jgi:AraC-like DNA-binding protein
MITSKRNYGFIILICVVMHSAPGISYPQEKRGNSGQKEKLTLLFNNFNGTNKVSSDAGLKYAEEALQLSKETGNDFIQVKALLYLGKAALRERNNNKARKYFSDAVSLSKEMNNEYLQAESHLNYGIFLTHAINRPDSALYFIKKAYSTALSLNDTTLLKTSTYSMISCYRLNGDPVKAITSAKTALEYNKNDKPARTGIYSELVLIYSDLGNMKEAVVFFNRVMELCEENKSYIQVASLANKMGGIEDQSLESALKFRKKALDIYAKIKEPFGIGYTYNLMGMDYASAGKSDEAIKCYLKAIDILSGINSIQHLAFANSNLAAEYIKLNKNGLAFPCLKKAITYGETIKDKLVLCDAYKVTAAYYRKVNNKDKALQYLKMAEAYAKEIKNPNFLKDIYNEYSLCYDAKGDAKNALFYLRLKNEIADTIQRQNSKKSYIEMMVKYETMRTKEEMTEAKENASLLRAESERKSFLFWSIAGGVTAIILILTLIYWKKLSGFFSFYKNISRKPFKDNRNNKSVIRAVEKDTKESVPINIETALPIMEALRKLIEEEKKYLDCNLTLNEAAKILNTNTAYLSRIINEQSGMNFNNYINKYRIEEAKKLLDAGKQDSMTFEGIGKSCGFLSRSAFNQAFKKFTGLTPTEYLSIKAENL